eukprot:7913122-Alexandrium_andersonii.AAC.1
MRQDRPGFTVFDDQGCQGRIAAVVGEEAIAHCNLRHGVHARDGARARGVRHPPTHAARAPRPERHASALASLALLVGRGPPGHERP